MENEQKMKRLTFTVSEAATILGISEYLAYGMVKSGDLKAIKLGRRWLVPRVVLEEMLGEKIEIIE
jgi:excisionase family DNA binding protein